MRSSRTGFVHRVKGYYDMFEPFTYTRSDNARRGAYRALRSRPPLPEYTRLALWQDRYTKRYKFTLTKTGYDVHAALTNKYRLVKEF